MRAGIEESVDALSEQLREMSSDERVKYIDREIERKIVEGSFVLFSTLLHSRIADKTRATAVADPSEVMSAQGEVKALEELLWCLMSDVPNETKKLTVGDGKYFDTPFGSVLTQEQEARLAHRN